MARFTTRLARFAGAAAGGLALLTASPALAQPVFEVEAFNTIGAAPGLPGPANISPKDLTRYADILALDDDQRAIAAELLADFTLNHQQTMIERSKELSAAMEAFQESQDMGALMKAMEKASTATEEASQRLTTAFLEDLQLLLTPEQADRWIRVEQTRRRDINLPLGNLPGESVDLIRVAQDLELTAIPEAGDGDPLQALLDRYAHAMDLHLIEREETLDDFSPLNGDIPNPEELAEIMEARTKLSNQIVELNRRFVALMTPILTPEDAQALKALVRELSYPSAYRKSSTDKHIDLVQAFEDLTPDQAAQLRTIADDYKRKAAEIREQLIRALDERAASGSSGGVVIMPGGASVMMEIETGAPGDKDPLREARQAKADLEKQYKDRLSKLLNDEQRARLPKEPTRQRFGSGGGGAFLVENAISVDGEGTAVEVIIIEGDEPAEPAQDSPEG